MKRQRVRKLISITSLLLFPITIYYFSPVLILQGAFNGIVSGSAITFGVLLISAIFLGRGFCSYVCPAGALQEVGFSINDKPSKIGRRKYIKYVIWGIWLICIVIGFILNSGIKKIDPIYMTEYGISISEPMGYIIYYGIILLIILPALICGKRAFCHYFCWMAPFMVLGIKLRKMLHLPGLHIEAEQEKCMSCKLCSKKCPMSLEVDQMVVQGKCEDSECILCGECIDICPKKVLSYKISYKK